MHILFTSISYTWWFIVVVKGSHVYASEWLSFLWSEKEKSDYLRDGLPVLPQPPRNNWAVIVDTSRHYTNYRHAVNALSFYEVLRSRGIPDSNIILMLPDALACSPRNPAPGVLLNGQGNFANIYKDDVEVDFKGEEVTVDNFIRVLTGRQSPWTPINKRLLSDENSYVLVYITGHGGDGYLRFQEWEVISSPDFATAIEQMYQQKRYRKIFFITESCQCGTLHKRLYTPGIFAIGSSKKGQNSYSYADDRDVGAAIIDRFTYHSMEFFRRVPIRANTTIKSYVKYFNFNKLMSDVDVRTDLWDEAMDTVPITDFIGSDSIENQIIQLPEVSPLFNVINDGVKRAVEMDLGDGVEEFPLLVGSTD